ncbi:hypothetical protein GCM10009617_03170 [Leifsonia poae]|uniref:Uncharacterized protein n=1 Tax=Leifsonia poae TaxID=110933 RepID=A0A9W6LYL9_9MICO|nr:hypothetical protein GCM10017584_03170 [Leifsonia poae]
MIYFGRLCELSVGSRYFDVRWQNYRFDRRKFAQFEEGELGSAPGNAPQGVQSERDGIPALSAMRRTPMSEETSNLGSPEHIE